MGSKATFISNIEQEYGDLDRGWVAAYLQGDTDLFHRIWIEGELERLNKTLERRVTERTAQLEAVNQELVKEITKRTRIERELRNLTLIDELTGLYNRRGFLTLAAQQVKLAHRMGVGLSLVYADLDGLKWINDTFGHAEGSRVLCQTAGILRETFRDSDIMARLGGDEFTILVMATSDHTPEIIAIRLQEKLADYNALKSHPYELSLSVGIASLDPKSPIPIEELIAKADEKMYENKRSQQKSATSRYSVSSLRLR
jgi:diguanylate cyclase (GGDEF)-like protein